MREVMRVLAAAGFSVLGIAGCGSSDDSRAPPHKALPEAIPGAIPCGNLETQYEGDELCILPPEPGEGIQFHIGPKNYDDPAELAKFELPGGSEETLCYYLTSSNPESFNFYEQRYRMRPGSHHLIIHMNTQGATREEGWGRCDEMEGFIPIGGTQRSNAEFPEGGVIAPEDQNLFRPLIGNVLMKFEMHFFNASSKPILREAWVNFMKKDAGEAGQILGGVFMIGGLGMAIQPHTQQTLNYECTLEGVNRRVVSIFGHRHAYTKRFSVWAHRSGQRELIYEDYDWLDPTELFYNSVVQNPPPDPDKLSAGGVSGIINLVPGDKLEWECEVDNTSDNVLNFRNAVYEGEMCNVFGSMVGGTFWSCAVR